MKSLNLPLNKEAIKRLRPGEEILLNGSLLTARDAAHKRLCDAIKLCKKLPIDLKDETIYYAGPTPQRKGQVIGSCGPTTSSRMDPFVGPLVRNGVLGMVGKGERSKEVNSLIKKYGVVYFVTVGGAGAYLSEKIVSSSIVAYKDLGTEAIRRIVVKDFPAIVSIK
ncbi:MAG: FumA C-terminus/TtdB family hydratase beta subunit [Candidatus Omnitrophota bacterium]